MKTKFNPSDEQVRAAETVFKAMAYTESIRPVIIQIQSELLDFWKFEISEHENIRGDIPKIVSDPKYTYLLDEDDFRIYHAELQIRYKNEGFVVPEDCCPLLIAEDIERQAKRALIDSMKPITGFDTDMILATVNGLSNYKKAVELTLKLLAPLVDKGRMHNTLI